MVEEETRRYRPTKNYLEHLPPLNVLAFETDVIKHEFERMQNRLAMDVLSMKRYELPPPPPGKMNDLTTWSECIDNSSAQLAHQETRYLINQLFKLKIINFVCTNIIIFLFIRICNLELMMEFGCEAWKAHLEVLNHMVGQVQKQLQILKKQIQEVNWGRKSMQTQGGEKLRALEAQWVGLVSKNYEIEQAIVHLEVEINKIKVQQSENAEVNDVPGVEQEPGVPEVSASDTVSSMEVDNNIEQVADPPIADPQIADPENQN